MEHNELLLLRHDKFVPVRVEIAQNKGVQYLLIDKKPRIDLSFALVSRNVEVCVELLNVDKSLCFEIVYDKQFVFLCQNDAIYKEWISKLAQVAHTWGVFGYPIECAVKKSSWRFPIPLFRSIQYLIENDAQHMEGIFRTSASYAALQKVEQILDRDSDVDMSTFEEKRVAASLLKDYLRQLPEPLIPYNVYDEFIALPKEQNPEISGKNMVEKIPIINQDSLWVVCSFLVLVIQNKDVTKMNENNIATCFGLTLVRPPPQNNIDEMTHVKGALAAFEVFIRNAEKIFESVKERNIKLGIDFPKYPCVIPHPKIPFYKLAAKIKRETDTTPLINLGIKKSNDAENILQSVHNEADEAKYREAEELNQQKSLKDEITDSKMGKFLGNVNGKFKTLVGQGEKQKESSSERKDRTWPLWFFEKEEKEEVKDDNAELCRAVTLQQINTIEDLKRELEKVKTELSNVKRERDELKDAKRERDELKKKYEPDTFVEEADNSGNDSSDDASDDEYSPVKIGK
ncbi:hypothetical protein EIN_058420 [Entamoeba invadens IP1]|uniref:hypothetical protein n=1 Tax=Entamoeba invadens IP1 TaxID=370355 RepID=UPI0002C3F37E|nr:hypothetical protein EIN_058420 [Entamoeba invadens IP1]ELP93397.1 hypothetical protein EIN_058420 [Entamoeba invadens IP1]|eukprot:XP_004260168.1 hypothetical protein EIN_058420 [Entamoeba invadens IP1]